MKLKIQKKSSDYFKNNNLENKTVAVTINKTTMLKGLAILFVLFSHLGILYCPGVPIFLLLSGYGLVISYNKKIKKLLEE